MTEELLFKTYETLDEVKHLKEYLRMLELKERIKEDLSDLLMNFSSAKKDVLKYADNKYADAYLLACQNLSKIKEELYTNELVIEYKENEKYVQKYLDNIMDGLVKTARGEETWENNQKEK